MCELLKDPERLRVGLEEHIRTQRETTRNGDPEKEMNVWLDKLSGLDQERRGYQRLAARGHMTDEELDEVMRELEESCRTIKRELEGRSKLIEDLERAAMRSSNPGQGSYAKNSMRYPRRTGTGSTRCSA